jgi:predicted glycosyltransferase
VKPFQVIVPRVTPRSDPLVRAERMSALGLLDLGHPEELRPESLGDWLLRATDARRLRPEAPQRYTPQQLGPGGSPKSSSNRS